MGWTAVWLGLAAAACSSNGDASETTSDTEGESDTEGGSDTDGDLPEGVVRLEPEARLVRISMALRGRRPSAEDLARIRDDPDALEDLVASYLETREFGAIVRDLHDEALLLQTDYIVPPAGFPSTGPLADADPYHLNRSVTQAPLRFIEHVIAQDRPYSDIVTADETMANAVVAALWGLPYDAQAGGWQSTTWNDGRPGAGILSDSWLLSRYSSTPANANRGRANAIARALLCTDFLDRDLELDAEVDLADPEAVADAVSTVPSCIACHNTLDPLASYFDDFVGQYLSLEATYPLSLYYENYFSGLLQIPVRDPSYFGTAAQGLDGLGQAIAQDPRFARCATRRFYAYFHQLDLDEVPADEIETHLEAFEASGLDAKALVASIVTADAFAVSHATRDDVEARGMFKLRPIQIELLLAQLTGFEWRTDLRAYDLGRVDLLDDSFLGYRVLAGGIDGVYVTRSSHTWSATSNLVFERATAHAARAVVRSDLDLDDPSARRLLTAIDELPPSEAALREQIAVLQERIGGTPPSDEERELGWSLFRAALEHTSGNLERSLEITITALLRDVEVAFY